MTLNLKPWYKPRRHCENPFRLCVCGLNYSLSYSEISSCWFPGGKRSFSFVVPEALKKGIDGDIHLRPEFSKISHSLHNVWLCVSVVSFPSVVGASFCGDGKTRYCSMSLTKFHWESFITTFAYLFVSYCLLWTAVFGFTLGPWAVKSLAIIHSDSDCIKYGNSWSWT